MLEYTLHRSSRRKRSVALNIEADGSLHVLAPMRTSIKWIESFITERHHWIANRRDEVKMLNDAKQTKLTDAANVSFLGQNHTLCIESPSSASFPRPVQRSLGEDGNDTEEQQNIIPLTVHSNPASPDYSVEIELALRLWYKKQARNYFVQRAAHWADLMGLQPSRVVVTSPKRQWGSCSPENVIRLNWRLMVMPPEVVDYVIVHELAHIKHKNHGKWFWNLVSKYVTDYKIWRGELRQWEKRHPSSF